MAVENMKWPLTMSELMNMDLESKDSTEVQQEHVDTLIIFAGLLLDQNERQYFTTRP